MSMAMAAASAVLASLVLLPAPAQAGALAPTTPHGAALAKAGNIRDAIHRVEHRTLASGTDSSRSASPSGGSGGTGAAAPGAEVPFAPDIYISNGTSTVLVSVDANGLVSGSPTTLKTVTDAALGPAGDSMSYRPVPSTGTTVVEPLVPTPFSVDYPESETAVAWAPAGDGFVESILGEPVAQWTNPDMSVSLGAPADVTGTAVSPYGSEIFVRQATPSGSSLLVGPTPFRGLTGLSAFSDLGLSDYTPGNPAVGQEPGVGIFPSNDGATYLAFEGTVPGSGEPRLFVDHQDAVAGGTAYANPIQVADTGQMCPDLAAPEFSPDRRMLAYVKAVGPTGSECDAAEVHVKLAGADGRYSLALGADTVIWTSTTGAPAPTRISWRPNNPQAALERVDGLNRYEVSANTAFFWDQQSADALVVAGGLAYADALTGGPLAAANGGPSILTAPTTLRAETAEAIDWALKPGGTIYVVGGPASVSDGVLAQLGAHGWNVTRIGGANRYEVAVNVAKQLDALRGGLPTSAFVSSGTAFADALVAGPAATANDGPVLLSSGSVLPTVTADYLDSLASDATLYAIGGSGSASIAGDPRTEVVGGANRYEVAGNVAQRFFSGWGVLALADGRNWPDAVSGGTLMANWGQPVLLTDGTATLPSATLGQALQTRESIDVVLGFGGYASVPDGALTSAQAAAGSQTTYFGPDLP
jgi:putative cell wall-binding protein